MRVLMLWIYLLWVGIGGVVGTDSSSHHSKLTDQKTTSTSTSSTSRTSTSIDSVSLLASDRGVLRILLVKDINQTYYYMADARLGSQEIGLRLDLLQPDVWTFNANEILDCDDFFDFYEAHSSLTSLLPEITVAGHPYDASRCYYGSAYATLDYRNTSTTAGLETPTRTSVYNDQSATVAYPQFYSASGIVRTDKFSIMNDEKELIQLKDFSFVLVENASVVVGGLGLMLHPAGSGFIDTLVSLDLIDSASYSLIIGNNDTAEYTNGYLLPGVVDQQYYEGDFYEFDIPPYTGFRDDIGNAALFPSVQMDDIRIQNGNTQQSVSLKSEDGSIPVLIDSQTLYSYLPLNVLINVAIQLNAVYNPESYRWIVECDTVRDTNANIEFVFGNLTVSVPITEILMEAYSNNSLLTYSNGKQACFLSLLPSTISGYNGLGLPFLEKIYMAVDNEGKKIALANRNSKLDLQGEYFDSAYDDEPKEWSASLNATSHSTVDSTIAYIQSGSIPFATPYNQTDTNTLTFSSTNDHGPSSVPAKFSGTIRSGEVFVTGDYSNLGTSFTEAASAAKENSTSTKNGANMVTNPLAYCRGGPDVAKWNIILLWMWTLGSMGFFVAVLFW